MDVYAHLAATVPNIGKNSAVFGGKVTQQPRLDDLVFLKLRPAIVHDLEIGRNIRVFRNLISHQNDVLQKIGCKFTAAKKRDFRIGELPIPFFRFLNSGIFYEIASFLQIKKRWSI